MVLANDGFLRRSEDFLPWMRPWEMGKTLIQVLNLKNALVYFSIVV